MKVIIDTNSKIIEILEGTDFEISHDLPFMVEDFSVYTIVNNTHESRNVEPNPVTKTDGLFQHIKDSSFKVLYKPYNHYELLEALTKGRGVL